MRKMLVDKFKNIFEVYLNERATLVALPNSVIFIHERFIVRIR